MGDDSEATGVRPGRPTKNVLELHDVYWGGTVQPDRLLQHFKREGRVSLDAASKIISDGSTALRQEPTLLHVSGPVSVVGDIHGQFFDLLRVFKIGGDPSTSKYLFLGDYVDRGFFSIECMLYLWALKIRYPKNIYLLRGNHECRHLTEYFTFQTECTYKYSRWIYDECMKSFDCLPLAAILDTQFLCVHGGLSPEITTLRDIELIDRFQEPPAKGPMCDLLWADPSAEFGPENEEPSTPFFSENAARGCSYYFTYQATCRFLENNDLLCLVRAHEVQDAGFRMYETHYSSGFPSMICVFSAPNYLDVYNNKGAVLQLGGGALKVKQFVHAPHPYWLPNFMDVFTWSLPFVAEKVAEMLHTVVKSTDGSDKDSEDEEVPIEEAASLRGIVAERESSGSAVSERGDVIRQKIRSVGRMARLFSVLREEREGILKLKGLCPSGQIPCGTLLGSGSVEDVVSSFEKVQAADAVNEKLPPQVTPPTPGGLTRKATVAAGTRVDQALPHPRSTERNPLQPSLSGVNGTPTEILAKSASLKADRSSTADDKPLSRSSASTVTAAALGSLANTSHPLKDRDSGSTRGSRKTANGAAVIPD